MATDLALDQTRATIYVNGVPLETMRANAMAASTITQWFDYEQAQFGLWHARPTTTISPMRHLIAMPFYFDPPQAPEPSVSLTPEMLERRGPAPPLPELLEKLVKGSEARALEIAFA